MLNLCRSSRITASRLPSGSSCRVLAWHMLRMWWIYLRTWSSWSHEHDEKQLYRQVLLMLSICSVHVKTLYLTISGRSRRVIRARRRSRTTLAYNQHMRAYANKRLTLRLPEEDGISAGRCHWSACAWHMPGMCLHDGIQYRIEQQRQHPRDCRVSALHMPSLC